MTIHDDTSDATVGQKRPEGGLQGGEPAQQWLDEPTGAGWYWVQGWIEDGPTFLYKPFGEWATENPDRTAYTKLNGRIVLPILEPDDVPEPLTGDDIWGPLMVRANGRWVTIPEPDDA